MEGDHSDYFRRMHVAAEGGEKADEEVEKAKAESLAVNSNGTLTFDQALRMIRDKKGEKPFKEIKKDYLREWEAKQDRTDDRKF